MGKHTCMDCGSADDVRAQQVDSWPADTWGTYYLCRTCREVLEDLEMRSLAKQEQRLLDDWGTLRSPAPAAPPPSH